MGRQLVKNDHGTILYVGNFELPDKGAAAHRVMTNGKLFGALGYRTVYLGVVRDTEPFEGIRAADCGMDGIEGMEIYEEAYPVGSAAWVRHLFHTDNIRAVLERYDDIKIILLYNVPYVTLCRVRKLVRGSGIRVCYDCTEWNAYTAGNFVKRLYKKLDTRQIQYLIGRKTDGLIVISKRMENRYRGHKNLLRLPPLVDTGAPIWNQELIPTDAFEFCFAGTIDNKEKLETVISAFAALEEDNTLLRIIGIRQDDFLMSHPECGEDIRRAGERIIFMGRLSHEETVRHVLSCGAYVFVREPSLRNEAGFPTKFAEAHTCGVPVITTDVSDVGTYFHKAGEAQNGILLHECSRNEILSAMKTVSASGRNGERKPLSMDFDYRSYMNDTKDWLKRICDEEK